MSSQRRLGQQRQLQAKPLAGQENRARNSRGILGAWQHASATPPPLAHCATSSNWQIKHAKLIRNKKAIIKVESSWAESRRVTRESPSMTENNLLSFLLHFTFMWISHFQSNGKARVSSEKLNNFLMRVGKSLLLQNFQLTFYIKTDICLIRFKAKSMQQSDAVGNRYPVPLDRTGPPGPSNIQHSTSNSQRPTMPTASRPYKQRLQKYLKQLCQEFPSWKSG